MNILNKTQCILILLVVLLVFSTNGMAQEQTDKSDKTGTNPVNFQRDIRIYNEYSWLNTEGDGNQNLTTLEFRTPFAGGKWQWRVRARYNSIEADLNDDGNDDIDEFGLGDTDMRFLTVPYLKGLNAFAGALEVFFDTASEDALGTGGRGGTTWPPSLQCRIWIFHVSQDKGRTVLGNAQSDLFSQTPGGTCNQGSLSFERE